MVCIKVLVTNGGAALMLFSYREDLLLFLADSWAGSTSLDSYQRLRRLPTSFIS